MVLNINFYKTKAGNEPVLEWLREQDADTRKRIGDDLRTVQIGWPLGMPLVGKMGGGIYEVRVGLADGIARLLFFQSGDQLVIVEGFIKKSQKTPPRILDNAKSRKSEFEKELKQSKKTSKSK